MLDRRHLTWAAGTLLGLTILGLAWSTALYLIIGWSLNAVRPWSVAEYIAAYGVPGPHGNALGISFAIAGAVACLLGAAYVVFRPRHYFGDARWAYGNEIRAAGLHANNGVLVGQLGGKFLRSNEPGHVLVTAPTRSGKGVGVVIPNLLSWPDSALLLDIKHENYEKTSGFRAAHGQRVYVWSPGDIHGRSHRFNFLDGITRDPSHRVTEIQHLGTILLPDPGPGEESMWTDEARDLFLGLVLYVLDTPGVPHTIGEVYRTLKTDADLGAVCEHLIETRGQELDPACVQSLANFAQKPVKERGGVKSNLTGALNLWANPVLDAATAHSDFDLRDLRRQRITIYVAIAKNQVKTFRRILNLFFQLTVNVLQRELPRSDEPYKVLMLVDEFAALGRMDVVADSLADLAGYGVRMVNIIQGLSQLDQHYRREGRESMTQNSAIQVYFAANDETTAKYVSERLGTKTIRTLAKSDPGGLSPTTHMTSYTKRDLMLPEEVRRLPDDREIVFVEGARPVLARKIRYYKDKAFKSRLLPPVTVPTLPIERIPPRRFDIAKPKRAHYESNSEEGFGPQTDDAAQVQEILALGDELQSLLAEEAAENPDAAAAADSLQAQLLALAE